MQWQAGSFSAASAVTIATNGTLFMDGTSPKTANGALTNAGTMIWTNTGNFAPVSVVHNLDGAVFDVRNDDLVDRISGSPVFINEGVIRKTAGAGTTEWQVPIINTGDIETHVGVQSMSGSGSSFNDGTRFLGAGVFRLAGSSALRGNIHSENLVLAGASVSDTNVLSGFVQWQAGSFSSASAVTVATNGTLFMDGAAAKTANGALTNAGTMIWTNTGDFAPVGVVHNLAGALFEVRNDDLVDRISGSPIFINEGVIRKTAGAGTTAWQVPLINSGIIDVQTGRMTLADGSEFKTGTSLVGDGLVVLNTGTITLSGLILSENLQLAGATLTGSGLFNGSLDWLSGTIAAALDLAIPADAVLHLRSSGAKTINGTITNAGSILWEGTGDLRIVGVLHNLPGGLFELRNDELLDRISGGGAPIVVNEGTLRKVAGTNTTISQIPVRNSGTIEINSGTLYLQVGLSNAMGTVQLGGGRLQLLSGQTLNLNGGALRGFGALTAHLLNNGEVLVAGNGRLTVSGNYTQALNGTLVVELGGLMAGVNHSLLAVSNRAQLSGRLHVRLVNGFVPKVGDVFQVMTFGTSSGDFVCRDGFLLLGHERRLQTEFVPTSLTLVTVAAPDPERPSISIRNVAGNLVLCWPSEFAGHLIQANSSLSTTNWTTIGTNSFLTFPIDINIPERYFRLLRP